MMNKDNEDMSEENDIKNGLEKDDDVDLDEIKSPSQKKNKEENSKKDKYKLESSPINHEKAPKSFSHILTYFFSKHEHSSSESDSSDSYDKPKKRKNKNLSEFQKSYIRSQKENFDKNYNILKEDFKLLEEYETKILKDTNLDIMFIMDLTGSMSIWLSEAKKNVKKIIEEIIDNNPGSKIRMSFIGYRDYLDKNEIRKYDNQKFTEDLEEFNLFLNKLDCTGGGDEPEDVVGALQQALNMNWQSNAKYAVLVADAPCHGKQYHNISYDKFPDGDPTGIKLEEVMLKFYEKGITFYCIEISNNTKIMFNIMKNIYNDRDKFHVEKLGNSVDQFSFFVAFSASVLLGNEKFRKINFSEILEKYRNETINKIMSKYLSDNNNINNNINLDINLTLTSQLINQIENLNLGGDDKKLFEFINRMSDLNINNENTNNNLNGDREETISYNDNNDCINIDLDEENIKKLEPKNIKYNLYSLYYNKNSNSIIDWINPTFLERNFKTNLQFSFSSFKKNLDKNIYEFHFVDNILNKEKTGKIPFIINKSNYNNKSQFLKTIAYEDLICEQMADYFNMIIDQNLPNLKQFIKFQRHILYELDIENSENSSPIDDFYMNTKYIISEDSTSIQLNICAIPTKRIFQNFTHFSYQISGGQLFITDLNYDKELKKITKYKIYNSKGEGYKKILEFFSGHICDNTCKVLKLANPRKKLNPIEVNEHFFMDRYLLDVNICECCSCPIEPNENNEVKKTCGFCSWKERQTKIKTNCSKCKSPFFYSTYIYNCLFINYPTNCEKCNSNF